MTDIRTFHLPDLGEGLPDATIVQWLVKVGNTVKLDAALVSMETAKAVVEVPSPFSGKLIKVYGNDGDVIATGAKLADFEIDASAPQRAEGTNAHTTLRANPSPMATSASGELELPLPPTSAPAQANARPDTGTVVGVVEASDRLVTEKPVAVGGVKAVPAVRALAKKLKVDLSTVKPSGAGATVTLKDVRDAAEKASTGVARASSDNAGSSASAVASVATTPSATATMKTAVARAESAPTPASMPIAPRHQGETQQLKGVRRNMARVMADALSKVVPTTLCDDADIHAWAVDADVSMRLLRAITTACKAVPALNAWFDGENLTRTLHAHVDIGIAVDTVDGLFVPALRNADALDAHALRAALDALIRSVRDRSIPPSELVGYTISLSNFGVFAGRYATPIVVPPTVAIIAAGKLRSELVPVLGGVEAHRRLPLSLTFDHRVVTGGEAARFLKAMLEDLARAE